MRKRRKKRMRKTEMKLKMRRWKIGIFQEESRKPVPTRVMKRGRIW